MNSEQASNNITCNWCGQQTYIIWVHGHGQCSRCGYNIDECCRGENFKLVNTSDINNTNGSQKKYDKRS